MGRIKTKFVKRSGSIIFEKGHEKFQRSYRQEHNIGSTRFYTLLKKGQIRYLDNQG